jgi:hypothetical protein
MIQSYTFVYVIIPMKNKRCAGLYETPSGWPISLLFLFFFYFLVQSITPKVFKGFLFET